MLTLMRAGGAQLYIDGQATGTAQSYAGHAPNISSAGVAYLGHAPNGASYFEGLLSEARIWGGARSAAEIADAYAERLSGAEEGLVGYWPLAEGSGTGAVNLSETGGAGTLQGGAGWATPVDEDGRWDEFDHLGVIARFPDLPADPHRLDRRTFQELFERATARWTWWH